MNFVKFTRDSLRKRLLDGGNVVPRELFDMQEYFKINGAIEFSYHKEKEDNDSEVIVAVSKNFRFGSIVSCGKNEKELDKNIRDAILTAFDIPSSYAKEANIVNINSTQRRYATA